MAKTIAELKQHFETLAVNQGCICEADYHAACMGAPDNVVSILDSWLVSSRFKLKKGIGDQYKQELLQRVRNPNVRDVKDTKEHTHSNPDKKQKSKKEPEEEHRASVTINKIVNDLKDADTEDEFLPPWRRREAAALDVSQASFAQWKDWLIDVAQKNVPAMLLDAWLAYIPGIETAADLDRAWKQLQSGDFTVPTSDVMKSEEFRYVDLPEGDDEEPLELDIKKSSLDPVEAHLARIAQVEYQSKMKKKVKFDNDVIFTVDVAETPAQKSAGLEIFESLSDSRGLLFPFERPDHVTFHMGRVKFPIDILFFMQDDLGFRVAKVVCDASPGDLDLWSHPHTDCVLEIPGGSCAKYGIGIDSYCKISDRVEV